MNPYREWPHPEIDGRDYPEQVAAPEICYEVSLQYCANHFLALKALLDVSDEIGVRSS